MKQRALAPVPSRSPPTREPSVRPRVMERLLRALRQPICLLVAPAGFGKTVALRAALREAGANHLYYKVRAENDTLLSFARGLAQTCEGPAPHASSAVADALDGAARSDSTGIALARWFCVHIEDYEGIVAVDDFHHAARDPDISAFLASVIERTEGRVRWVVATRDTGELPLASWSAYGRMDPPLQEADLRLSESEALDLWAATGLPQDRAQFEALYALTRAWPAGFRFGCDAALRITDFPSVAHGTREMMFGFLAEQVFAKLHAHERDFLLRTCVYPHVDTELLAHSGFADARAVVEALRRRTSFLQAESETIFLYHDLFGDFLQHELRRAGTFAAAAHAAGAVLEAAGDVASALRAYVRAGAAQAIAALLDAHGFDLVEHGMPDLVEDAIAALALEHRDRALILALRGVLDFRYKRVAQGESAFEGALRAARDPKEAARIAYQLATCLALSDRARAIASVEPFVFESSIAGEQALLLTSFLASGYAVSGESARAAPLLSKVLSLISTVSNEDVCAIGYARASVVAYHGGAAARAREFAHAALERAAKTGNYRAMVTAHFVVSFLAFDVDDTEESTCALEQAEACAARAGHVDLNALALLNRAYLEAERGNTECLELIARRLREIDAQRAESGWLDVHALPFAWRGDFEGACRILAAAKGLRPNPWRGVHWAHLALYYAAAGKREEAKEALTAADESLSATTAHDPRLIDKCVIIANSFYALTLLLLGRLDQSQKVLQRAREARHATPRLRALVKTVRALYLNALSGLARGEVAAALDELRATGYRGYAMLIEQLPLQSGSAASPFATLTEVEFGILREFAAGATSQQIADRSSRSKRTIDWHVASIMTKLACRSRRDAAKLARDHGLL